MNESENCSSLHKYILLKCSIGSEKYYFFHSLEFVQNPYYATSCESTRLVIASNGWYVLLYPAKSGLLIWMKYTMGPQILMQYLLMNHRYNGKDRFCTIPSLFSCCWAMATLLFQIIWLHVKNVTHPKGQEHPDWI